MTYKGYQAKVGLDEQAGVFYGEVINTRDVITFQGSSVKELEQAFADSVDDYLKLCAARGENPEKPFSGKFLMRVPPEVHRQMMTEARRQGKSLNAYVLDKLQPGREDESNHLKQAMENRIPAPIKVPQQPSRAIPPTTQPTTIRELFQRVTNAEATDEDFKALTEAARHDPDLLRECLEFFISAKERYEKPILLCAVADCVNGIKFEFNKWRKAQGR